MRYMFIACTLLLVACSPQNEHYYRTHPEALLNAIKKCPAQQPSQLSCKQLTAIANLTNELAYQLQTNPQTFGQKILALQQTIAAEIAELQSPSKTSELAETLTKNEQLLEQCLAVVQWLESPES